MAWTDEMDPWKELQGGAFSETVGNKLFSIGNNWYQVVFWIGVVGLALSLITLSISLMLKRNGRDVAMVKEGFITKIIIAIIIFAFPTIVGLIVPVLESLGNM